MAGSETQLPELHLWEYDKPPTLFDLVDNNILTNTMRIIIHALLRLWFRVYHRYEALDCGELSDASSCIVASNHSSHLDVIALLSAFPLRKANAVRTLAAKDYFFSNALIRFTSFLVANTVPLERRKRDLESFSYAQRAVEGGALLIVFPEGTRSPDGEMKHFMAGVGVLAKRFGSPILPAYIHGAHGSLPKGGLLPRPGKITVRFGARIDCADEENSKDGWIRIARNLERRVRQLAARS
jgi:1-acyl-sn-glycerol-3-phosphate acyltransferase